MPAKPPSAAKHAAMSDYQLRLIQLALTLVQVLVWGGLTVSFYRTENMKLLAFFSGWLCLTYAWEVYCRYHEDAH